MRGACCSRRPVTDDALLNRNGKDGGYMEIFRAWEDVSARADVVLLQNVFEGLAVGHGTPPGRQGW